MPRPKKVKNNDYFKAFPSALRGLMDDRRITQQTLADHLGKSRQAISCYCDGSSSPDWETMVKIARFFSVSTDYLVGKSPIKTPSIEIQGVCEYTGLSEASVKYLYRKQAASDPCIAHLIDSVLFSSDCVFFDASLLKLLGELLCAESGVDDSILGVLLDIADAKERYTQRNNHLNKEQESKVDKAKETLSANGLLAITADVAYRHSIEMAVAAFRQIVIGIVEKN